MAAVALALALAGPTDGLQALHSAQAEQSAQQKLVERLDWNDPPQRLVARRPADPDAQAEKRAAAWRADHLTCANRKGRTAAQYARECGAWLAEQMAAEQGR
jgi:hypothetical protein